MRRHPAAQHHAGTLAHAEFFLRLGVGVADIGGLGRIVRPDRPSAAKRASAAISTKGEVISWRHAARASAPRPSAAAPARRSGWPGAEKGLQIGLVAPRIEQHARARRTGVPKARAPAATARRSPECSSASPSPRAARKPDAQAGERAGAGGDGDAGEIGIGERRLRASSSSSAGNSRSACPVAMSSTSVSHAIRPRSSASCSRGAAVSMARRTLMATDRPRCVGSAASAGATTAVIPGRGDTMRATASSAGRGRVELVAGAGASRTSSRAQTCCTASTPGTKWRSRFSMPRLERRGRGRAARAGALHVEVHRAVLEALEGDVAAIHRHGRADAGRDQFLDHFDGLAVGRHRRTRRRRRRPALPSSITGLPERKCSMMTPRIAGFRWFHSVVSLLTETKSEPRNTPVTPGIENRPAASGDTAAVCGRAEIARLADENVAAGQEFQRRRIGRGFGLDEHLRAADQFWNGSKIGLDGPKRKSQSVSRGSGVRPPRRSPRRSWRRARW